MMKKCHLLLDDECWEELSDRAARLTEKEDRYYSVSKLVRAYIPEIYAAVDRDISSEKEDSGLMFPRV